MTLTEAEVEQLPDAVAGQALIEERLKHQLPEDTGAVREAVRRCYASAKKDEAESTNCAPDRRQLSSSQEQRSI